MSRTGEATGGACIRFGREIKLPDLCGAGIGVGGG
jgi:hypothetical protein